MTTTAHEDQFTADTERHIAQPYDVTAILRQNVADLERELQRQRERADKDDSAMASAREDLQSFIDSRDSWMARASAAEAEISAERKRLDWALKHEACYYQWGGVWRLCFSSTTGPCDEDIDSTDPRATIDELIAAEEGEKK